MALVRQGDGAPAVPSRREAGPGDRQGRAALRLLLAIPLALLVLAAWEFAMQTSAGYNEAERIGGGRAVLRELPATALLLAPVVAGLRLGVRSARSGARTGRVAIWAHAAGLALVALIVFEGAGPLLPAGVAAAGVVAGLRAARRPAVAGAGWHRRARVVAAAGVAASFLWLLAAQVALSVHAGGFPRAAVPGAVTLRADGPGRVYVYAEGNAPDTVGELGIQVTDPSGGTVAVSPMASRPQYLRGLRGGRAVGWFHATRAGEYRVVATAAGLPPVTAPYAPENPNGDFAIGRSVEGWMEPHEWGAAALLVTAVGSAAGLAVRRRSSGAPPPTPPS